MKPLSGRVALVSGGSRGGGRGVAASLAEAGADVVILYRKEEHAAQATVEELQGRGVRARALRASVESWDDCQAAVDAVVSEFGFVDILVNNAGPASRRSTVAEAELRDLERVVGAHAFGSFYLSKLVLPTMRSRARGDIIMISSVAGSRPEPHGSTYNMAKAAQEALAFTLAKEEMEHGIRVNVIAPGLFESDMGRRFVRGAFGLDDLDALSSILPYGRMMTPDDIGELVVFLCGSGGSYLNGQRIILDGSADLVALASRARDLQASAAGPS